MERIDEETIDRYCGQHSLSVDERLELCFQVCGPFEHTHRMGVVRRLSVSSLRERAVLSIRQSA